jgi:hypothetical protein
MNYNIIADGYLLTREEFIEDCKNKFFTDYDGYGYPVKNGKVATIKIFPSQLNIPEDATHIIWFNN